MHSSSRTEAEQSWVMEPPKKPSVRRSPCSARRIQFFILAKFMLFIIIFLVLKTGEHTR